MSAPYTIEFDSESNIHYINEKVLSIICMSSKDVHQSHAFNLLHEINERFQSMYPPKVIEASSDDLPYQAFGREYIMDRIVHYNRSSTLLKGEALDKIMSPQNNHRVNAI